MDDDGNTRETHAVLNYFWIQTILVWNMSVVSNFTYIK